MMTNVEKTLAGVLASTIDEDRAQVEYFLTLLWQEVLGGNAEAKEAWQELPHFNGLAPEKEVVIEELMRKVQVH